VSDEELVEVLNRATALVYTSRLEPFGFAPLEANACATPVVAVAEGGVRETMRNGVNGILVDREPEPIAHALQKPPGRSGSGAPNGRRCGCLCKARVEHRAQRGSPRRTSIEGRSAPSDNRKEPRLMESKRGGVHDHREELFCRGENARSVIFGGKPRRQVLRSRRRRGRSLHRSCERGFREIIGLKSLSIPGPSQSLLQVQHH